MFILINPVLKREGLFLTLLAFFFLPCPTTRAYKEEEVDCHVESPEHEDRDGEMQSVICQEVQAGLEVVE